MTQQNAIRTSRSTGSGFSPIASSAASTAVLSRAFLLPADLPGLSASGAQPLVVPVICEWFPQTGPPQSLQSPTD
jgi:hypothetical protein